MDVRIKFCSVIVCFTMLLSGEIDLGTRGDVTWGGASRRVTGAVSDKHPSFSQPPANGQIVIAHI